MTQISREEYSEKLKLYDKLVATNPLVHRKGATVPYTSLNGHMFSYLAKSGELALHLPAGARETFLKKYKTTLCAQYGFVSSLWVERAGKWTCLFSQETAAKRAPETSPHST